MLGILDAHRKKVIFNLDDVYINIFAGPLNSISFTVNGNDLLTATTINTEIFNKLKEKFQLIFEEYLRAFVRFSDRNYIFDLSIYADEINKICRGNQ